MQLFICSSALTYSKVTYEITFKLDNSTSSKPAGADAIIVY